MDLSGTVSGPVLVVAAHPDDEVLGCGGTIARIAASVQVVIAILGEGVTSRYATRGQADAKLLAALHEQSRTVGSMLGARDVRLLDLPDNRFDAVDLLDIAKRVEEILNEVRPRTVFTHHPGDLNVDHGITFRAVMTATRPTSGNSVEELYVFEVPSSTEWSFQRIEPAFRPNVFINITETLELKIQAMAQYEAEARPFPHPRSPEVLRAIALRWGSVAGCGYAEPFELIRAVR